MEFRIPGLWIKLGRTRKGIRQAVLLTMSLLPAYSLQQNMNF